MTTLIKPINPQQNLQSTRQRFFTMFEPIQETRSKQSDFSAYLLTPFIDGLILEPAFALDAAIELVNFAASLARACYLWTMNQQHSRSLVDYRSGEEFDSAFNHGANCVNAICAQTLNTVFSTLSWFTRPIASLVHAVVGDDQPTHATQHQYA